MSVRSFEGTVPNIHDDAYVDPEATLIGDVILRAQASVWPGTVLRGDLDEISVGERSNVQDNVVCHADPGFPVDIQADCTIGHGAVIHGATVKPDTIVGMNATLLNDSVVGSGSIVAAGSVVTEDQHIPSGVLAAGTPAEVKTELDREVDQLEGGRHYVELAEIYSADNSE
jgi:carbonic anhydrase/acetyltransferase-like protein (isoleucine patch superfamily)